MRNLRHALFAPGYASTRYNTLGYGHVGNDFIPAVVGFGTRSEDPVTQYGVRAVNEMKYVPIESSPRMLRNIFFKIENIYHKYFSKYVWITSLLIIFAWICAAMWAVSKMFSPVKLSELLNKLNIEVLIAPIIVASALVVYESLLTSVFCQPMYRYFHLTEPLRLIIAGCGAVLMLRTVSIWRGREGVNTDHSSKNMVMTIQERDLIHHYFSTRRTQWIVTLVILNIILFGWWVVSMLAHT